MAFSRMQAPVVVFVIAMGCFALAWYRWRFEGKKYWLTIAWWMAVAWAVWTTAYLAGGFLRR